MQVDLATTFMIFAFIGGSILILVLVSEWLDAHRKKHAPHSPH